MFVHIPFSFNNFLQKFFTENSQEFRLRVYCSDVVKTFISTISFKLHMYVLDLLDTSYMVVWSLDRIVALFVVFNC